MTKEEIYDSQINPLMAQIIEICREHRIAHVCTFSIPNDDYPGLCCTTACLLDECDPPLEFIDALECIKKPERSPVMVTTRDGSGNITRMDAIL